MSVGVDVSQLYVYVCACVCVCVGGRARSHAMCVMYYWDPHIIENTTELNKQYDHFYEF